MNKYKKIFSGLGLLSISTLIGASVVACANKKPKPSDSSTEGIDQNNNQGNSSKPEDGENTPGNPTPEAPKTPEKTPQQGDGSSNENSGNTSETDKKDKLGEGMKKEPEKDEKNEGGNQNNTGENSHTPAPKVTADEKYATIKEKIDKMTNINASAKTKLKQMLEEIKNKQELKEEQKLQELTMFDKNIDNLGAKLQEAIKEFDKLFDFSEFNENSRPEKPKNQENVEEKEYPAQKYLKEKLSGLVSATDVSKVLDEYKTKFSKYKGIINSDKFNGTEYNDARKKGLNGRLAKFYNDDNQDKEYTEALLIWNVYATIYRDGFKNKISKYAIVPEQTRQTFTTDSKVAEIPASKKTNPGIDLNELEKKVNKMVETVILVAKKAAELNIEKVILNDKSKEQPAELIKKLSNFKDKAKTIQDLDNVISKTKEIANIVKSIINDAKNVDEAKKKIESVNGENIDKIKSELDKVKAELTKKKN
ncbi:hypothetical protein [Mycoplasmopsis cynos]|uniref:Lipoprotein n=1 Tax=Mycoplasmopsis cynos TaxID=171284 RepID=A0A449AHI8_9BACT|nr:hypothetical protein [Mycoplasmopsis cynos]TQC54459.1 hypothetical protein E1I74_03240 [Mycoplasmopsis cynos]VEU64464.1 Uncharacterised protein [Mycoplasmopsis cynos]